MIATVADDRDGGRMIATVADDRDGGR